MSRSSLSRRVRKGPLAGRLIWRIRLLPPRTIRGMWMGASASAVAAALLAAPMPALGADECGVVPPGGTATCTAAGNPYADGIVYTVDDLTIVLQGTVNVTTNAVGEVGVGSYAAGALVIDAYPGSAISTAANSAPGVYARSTDGPVSVTVHDISTLGDYSRGVFAISQGAGADGAVRVTATSLISTGGTDSDGVFVGSTGGPVTIEVVDISTTGASSDGIRVTAFGVGAYAGVRVSATGLISTTGSSSDGVEVLASGPVTVDVVDVTTTGAGANGIQAASFGAGAYGAVSVTATGLVSTSGSSATGVNGGSLSGPVTISVADVYTAGMSSVGVNVFAYGGGGGYSFADVSASGLVMTTGDYSPGIVALGYDSATVSVVDLTTTGLESDGIRAVSGGPVSVTATGIVTTTGYGARAIVAYSLYGPVTVSVADVLTLDNESAAISARSAGVGADGAVDVTATGLISTTGIDSDGVFATGFLGPYGLMGGPVTISVVDVTTAGAQSEGIYARSFGTGAYGAVTITSTGLISTAGFSAEGVDAIGQGPVTVNVVDVTTTGNSSEAITALGSYAIDVTSTGLISTAGMDAEGVSTLSFAGPTTVNVVDVTTTGDESEGILVGSFEGDVSVTATGLISTTGLYSTGIGARTYTSGAITIDVVDVDTTGSNAPGIAAVSMGADPITVTSTGTISTAGTFSDGILARNTGGTGSITIDARNVISTQANGISVLGNGELSVSAVNVTSELIGIAASSLYSPVSVTVTGAVITTGPGYAFGVAASSEGGDVSVTVADVTTVGVSSFGVFARSEAMTGTVTVNATGTITTTGATARGVYATATYVPVMVTVADVVTAGTDAPGVLAMSTGMGAYGQVSVTGTGTITTVGNDSYGVTALSANGPVDVSVANVTTVGIESEGVYARSYGTDAYGAVTVSATGLIVTSGMSANGVTAYSMNGPANVTVVDVTTIGDNSEGVFARSTGTGAGNAVTVTSTGAVQTTGANATGLFALGTDSPVTVNAVDVITTGFMSPAIFARSLGAGADGAIDVNVTGQITTIGAASEGVLAQSTNGPVSVSVVDVTTVGATSEGVLAISNGVGDYGAVSVTSTGFIGTSGNNSSGIAALSNVGPVTVQANNISTLGHYAYGVYATNAIGGAGAAVQVTTTGLITTVGYRADGVLAVGASGPVTVSVADVATSADFADGVFALASGPDGDAVTVTVAGFVSTLGYAAHGVAAISTAAGPVTVNVVNASTVGTSASGVFARSTGSGGPVSVTTTGLVSSSGNYAHAVSAYSGGGDVTVSVADVITLGDFANGVYARSAGGPGAVSVTGTGLISTVGYLSHGVFAYSDSGPVMVDVADVATSGNASDGVHALSVSGDIMVTVGNVMTVGNFAQGVSAVSVGGTGAVSVTGTGLISTVGYMSHGVFAYSGTGPVTVNVNDVSTVGLAYGVLARSSGGGGPVSVTSTGLISTSSIYAHGVVAYSAGGDVAVSVANVSTLGDFADGVHAESDGGSGAVQVTSTGLISTTGYRAYGVYATSTSGPVTVAVASISTSGAYSDGVRAFTPGSALIHVTTTGLVSTSGLEANGVEAVSFNGPVTVNVADITTSGTFSNGVEVNANGALTVNAAGTISTSGHFGSGIDISSTNGPVMVSVTGDITTLGDFASGVDAFSSNGAVSVTATGTISTAGMFSDGVGAASFGGPVSVTVADVTVTGSDSQGVYGGAVGDTVAVTVTGALTTTGANSDGVRVNATSSTIVITSTGSITSGPAYSIYSVASTMDDVRVFGALNAASLLNAGDDALTFFSTADLSGLGSVDAGPGTDALAFDGLVADIEPSAFVNFETATITNGAFITDAPAGASTLMAPLGIFVLNGSTLKLGHQDDLFGTLTIDPTSRVIAIGDSPSLNTITGDLVLAGELTQVDGLPDDQTDVTGQLTGLGGSLAMDVTFGIDGPVQSDLVTFGGDLTGTAFISVNPVATAMVPGAPPPLVTFGGMQLADLGLAPALAVDGYSYGLEQIGNSLFLNRNGVSEPVAGAMALGAALAPLQRDLFGDLGARIGTGDALRRPGLEDGAAAIWGRMGGTHHDGGAGGNGYAVDFDMNHFYVQLGADLFRAGAGDGALVGGVMAHYGHADGGVTQPGGAPSTDFDVASYGVGLDLAWYAGDGNTYVDLAGLVSWHNIDVAGQDSDAMSYTVGLEAGTRVPLGETLSLAPLGQLVYTHSDIDDLGLPSALLGSPNVSIEDPESLEARGLMMLEHETGAGSVQFGGGLAYEFLGDSTTRFGAGSDVHTSFEGLSGELLARGQYRVAENVTVYGDLRGRLAFDSDGTDSFGGLIGVRIDF